MSNAFQADPKEVIESKMALAEAVSRLPPLPSVIRYYDTYFETVRSIEAPATSMRWPIWQNGVLSSIGFERIDPSVKPLLQGWVVWMLMNLEPYTSIAYYYRLHSNADLIHEVMPFLFLEPIKVKYYWETYVLSKCTNNELTIALKSLLSYLCNQAVGPWSNEYAIFVSEFLHGGKRDKYRAVRDGEVFLSTQEEALIVEYFDTLNEAIRTGPQSIADDELRDACLLYWNYQHGFRSVQLSLINLNDVRQLPWEDGPPTIHVTFEYAKQRTGASRYNPAQNRTMNRDWVWMLSIWLERRKQRPESLELDRPNSLFGMPNVEIADAICRLTEKITGRRRTPTELHHTAAQRQVDAGCFSLELAEFMLHAQITTGLVYFDFSPTQADRINKALGLSPVYSALSEVIKTGKIDKAKLLGLPNDQQIVAAPHGRLIIGIGGCGIGQKSCTKNPGLSCYTCQKFMPLNERDVHEEARNAVEATVREFIAAARFDKGNPAFMQLRRTLEAIDQVLDDVDPEVGT
ncbi:hypothetical protein [Flexibacterium corallicola]|uniref:hypothetical protein n=1 Tax=Flexibacterium corallicola TaxID=3037259 RepID=UPI00286F958A|nr:hypothetical protein [Pseudovibrio sp. M1P-2-3]